MDTGRGVICRGPEGPDLVFDVWDVIGQLKLPSTADLLQEDVFLRFLASRKSSYVDRAIVNVIAGSYDVREVAFERCDQPTVFSTLTQTPIAVANNIWENFDGNLSEQTVLENGVTR